MHFFIFQWHAHTKDECKEMEKSCMQIGFLACKEKTFYLLNMDLSVVSLSSAKRGVTGEDLQILDDPKLQDRGCCFMLTTL